MHHTSLYCTVSCHTVLYCAVLYRTAADVAAPGSLTRREVPLAIVRARSPTERRCVTPTLFFFFLLLSSVAFSCLPERVLFLHLFLALLVHRAPLNQHDSRLETTMIRGRLVSCNHALIDMCSFRSLLHLAAAIVLHATKRVSFLLVPLACCSLHDFVVVQRILALEERDAYSRALAAADRVGSTARGVLLGSTTAPVGSTVATAAGSAAVTSTMSSAPAAASGPIAGGNTPSAPTTAPRASPTPPNPVGQQAASLRALARLHHASAYQQVISRRM